VAARPDARPHAPEAEVEVRAAAVDRIEIAAEVERLEVLVQVRVADAPEQAQREVLAD
jgi:hypothetical protein